MANTEIVTVEIDAYEQHVADVLNQVSSGISNPEQWLVELFGGGKSASGIQVGVDQSLGLPAVWNSVNLIAGHIASMPLEIRKRTTNGSEVVTNHPAHNVLNVECNELQTTYTLKQTLMAHALLTGNGRAWINRNGVNQPTELFIMSPHNSFTYMVDGEKFHGWSPEPNHMPENPPFQVSPSPYQGGHYIIPDSEVLHIPGLGWNGLWGYNLLAVAKDVFGLDGAGLESQSWAFNNGGRPGLLLMAAPGKLRTQKEATEFMAYFRKAHEGVSKTGRTALLRDGMTAQSLEAAPIDESLTGLREFSRQDIALLLGTEYLLGESAAVYKDLPSRMSAYVTNTLNKWMECWERECARKLLSAQQFTADSHYFHFDARALVRGNPNDLATYTASLRQQGAINQNEVRQMHGFNEVPGLDSYDNPNVVAPQQAQEEESEPGTEPAEDTQDRARRFLAHNFKTLIRWEAQHLQTLTKRDGAFLDRVDTFYSGTMYKKLSALCRELDVPAGYVTDHIDESKSQILDVAGVVDREGLPGAIKELTKNWEARAGVFADV